MRRREDVTRRKRGAGDLLPAATGLLDDRTRLVIHVRLEVPQDLEDDAKHRARCARTLDHIREYLLPGQRVEMCLVFDTGVHACRGVGDAANPAPRASAGSCSGAPALAGESP